MSATPAFDIDQQLDGLFAQSPVVMWEDLTGEFAEQARERPEYVDAAGGVFALKCRINARETGERILVYRAGEVPDPDWLTDVQFYAAPFSADATAMIMRGLGLQDSPEMRAAVSRYRAFLSKPAHLKRVRALANRVGTARELDVAVMLASMGQTGELVPEEAVAALLSTANPESALRAMGRAGAIGRFTSLVRTLVGWEGVTDLDEDGTEGFLFNLAARVLEGAFACQMGLDGARAGIAAFCNRVLLRWRSRDTPAHIAGYSARSLDAAVSLPYAVVSVHDLGAQDVYPEAEERIVAYALRAVASPGCDARRLLALVDMRKGTYWWQDFADYYQVISAAAALVAFKSDHPDGFSAPDAQTLWKNYIDFLWHADQHYRHVQEAASRCIVHAVGNLDDPLRVALAGVEALYRGWFLNGLNGSWVALTEYAWTERGYVPDIDMSSSFYILHARGLRKKTVCGTVIISDALRYEVACELADRLSGETTGTVEVMAQQAPFPTVTPVGMAALLPHVRLRVSDDARQVDADGASTAGTAARQAVLRATPGGEAPGARALTASEFFALSVAGRRQLGHDAGFVYIYHNRIDAVGEADEERVPAACSDAIEELVALVQACARSLGPNVLVTADHGFLYSARDIGDVDKVSASDVMGEVTCVTHRRAVIACAGAESESLMPVSLKPLGRSDLVGFTPRGCQRILQPGDGARYVHGGISLEEVCVPVLRFHAARAGSKFYRKGDGVQVALLSSSRSIFDWSPVIAFQQLEGVGGKVLASTFRVRFEDAVGTALSDEASVVADRPFVDGEAGTIRVRFTMLPAAQPVGECHLVVRDEATGEAVLRERFSLELSAEQDGELAW